MKLIREWQIQLLEKAEKAIEYTHSIDIEYIGIYDLNESNLEKYPLDNSSFKIKGEDGISDVIININILTEDKVSLKITVWLIAIILTYFSEERGDITEKVKYLLNKKLW